MDDEWVKIVAEARALVAKGYSIEIPRWEIREFLRDLMRQANAAGQTDAADQFMWLIEEWNAKA